MNTIYLKPVGGLANRIRVINSGYAFAQQNKLELVVIWELNNDLNAPYSRLFEPISGIRVVDLKPGVNIVQSRIHYFPDKMPKGWRSSMFSIFYPSLKQKNIVWYDAIADVFARIKKNYNPDEVKNQTSLNQLAAEEHEPLFDAILLSKGDKYIATSWNILDVNELQFQLKPQSQFQDKVGSLKISPSNTVGVHIRRTDHNWSIEHSANGKFISMMHEAIKDNPQLKFFLASDDDQTIAEMQSTFPNRIIRFNHEAKNRNDPSGIDSAILDLFALAACGRVIGSYLSTFSDLAGNIGNIKVEYAI